MHIQVLQILVDQYLLTVDAPQVLLPATLLGPLLAHGLFVLGWNAAVLLESNHVTVMLKASSHICFCGINSVDTWHLPQCTE